MEIQDVSNTLNMLLLKAETLRQQITEKGSESMLENPHPPAWSGKNEDIQSFLQSVDDWLQDPVLRRAKDIIHALKQEAQDTRDFTHLPRGYLLDIAKMLMNAEGIISRIEIHNFKRSGAKYVLNILVQQQVLTEIERALVNIKDYMDTLNEKVISIDCGGCTFIDTVKNDSINMLAQTSNFDRTIIENFSQNIQTAIRAFHLLKDLVSEDAYINEYKDPNDIDKIWNLSTRIREILNKTDPKEYASKNYQHPLLIEYQKVYEKKKDALSKQTLTRIKEELEDYKRLVDEWLEKVNAKICSSQEKFRRWKKVLQQYQGRVPSEMIDELDEIISKEVKFNGMSEVSIEILNKTLQQLENIEKRFAQYLTENIMSANARKIIEYMDSLENLQKEMEEKFWVALQEVIKSVPSLVLKLEWRGER